MRLPTDNIPFRDCGISAAAGLSFSLVLGLGAIHHVLPGSDHQSRRDPSDQGLSLLLSPSLTSICLMARDTHESLALVYFLNPYRAGSKNSVEAVRI